MNANILGFLLATTLWTVATLAAAEPSSRPNVLFIISDDQGWGDYGFMGHSQLATPNLDRLARESLTFTRGYTPVPLCRPSLATILTGLYPHQHGVTGNDPTLPDRAVNSMTGRNNPKFQHYYQAIIDNFAKRPNLVRELTSDGYVALQTGKWWEGDPIKSAGFTQAMTVGTAKGDRHGGAGLEIGRDGLEPVTRFIDAAGEKPWFVWYAPMLPHAPHTPPADLLQKYLKLAPSEPVARYWANVEWFDRTCGDLLRYLETKKLRENTIVIYVTDNGWIQDPAKANRPAHRSKLTPYEGGVRTPVMISWPGKVSPSLDKEHLASSVDLWPTLAALLQRKPPTALPGINLTDPAAVAGRQTVFGEQYSHNIADVESFTQSLEHRWIIDGDWKLIVPDPRNRAAGKPELYQVRTDPWEKTDLADGEAAKLKELSGKLDAWWKP